jgi:hypothetical protein
MYHRLWSIIIVRSWAESGERSLSYLYLYFDEGQ